MIKQEKFSLNMSLLCSFLVIFSGLYSYGLLILSPILNAVSVVKLCLHGFAN